MAWDKVDAVISLSGDAGPLAGILSEVKKKAEGIIPAENLEKIAAHLAASRTRVYQRICELIDQYQKPIFTVGQESGEGEGRAGGGFLFAPIPESGARRPGSGQTVPVFPLSEIRRGGLNT